MNLPVQKQQHCHGVCNDTTGAFSRWEVSEGMGTFNLLPWGKPLVATTGQHRPALFSR